MLNSKVKAHLKHIFQHSLRNGIVTVFVALGIISITLTGEVGPLSNNFNSYSSQFTDNVATSDHPNSNNNSTKIPATLSTTPWLEKAARITSLKDLHAITSGQKERELVASLLDDEIEDANPFSQLSSQYPLAVLLAKGVQKFNRSTYRTTGFRGEEGYDLLTYDVIHKDGTHSEIMAYRDKMDVELNREPLGPSVNYVLLSVYESSHSNYYNLFRQSELIEHGSIESVKALAMVSARVNASIPFLGFAAR